MHQEVSFPKLAAFLSSRGVHGDMSLSVWCAGPRHARWETRSKSWRLETEFFLEVVIPSFAGFPPYASPSQLKEIWAPWYVADGECTLELIEDDDPIRRALLMLHDRRT